MIGSGRFPANGRVVEAVDVIDDVDFDLSAGLPVAAPDQFRCQRREDVVARKPRYSCALNCNPRTVGQVRPCGGLRRAIALLTALGARSSLIRLWIAQPMARLETRSKITARSSRPSKIQT